MNSFITLITICLLANLTRCDEVEKLDESAAVDELGTSVGKLKRQLFKVPKGNAYSYTHVVQTHGPVRKVKMKVVHSPNDVTAHNDVTDWLDEEQGLRNPATSDESKEQPIPFTYPLFTPHLDNSSPLQYSTPTQLVYRLPQPYGHSWHNPYAAINLPARSSGPIKSLDLLERQLTYIPVHPTTYQYNLPLTYYDYTHTLQQPVNGQSNSQENYDHY